MNSSIEIETWLRNYLKHNHAVAGTVHLRGAEQLELQAAVNIPPKVIDAIRLVPKGRGMAGLAWERNAPVSTCNLKNDNSGDVRPGAKAVDANAAVAMPIHDENGEIRGIVGVAYMGEREMDDHELERLKKEAESLPLITVSHSGTLK